MTGNSVDQFIKDIELYYLNLRGKGIMLSPKEYELIANWGSRSVPKEIVMSGIRRAFERNVVGAQRRNREFRSLIECAPDVEELITKYGSGLENNLTETRRHDKTGVHLAVQGLNEAISSEKRGFIRKHYLKLRKRILELGEAGQSDVFGRLREIESDFYEDVFQNLSVTDQRQLIAKAEDQLSARKRFMTTQAHRESVISFRNELLIKELGLINFNTFY